MVSLGKFSKELCGGTHTERTGDIGFLKIVAESSVASGIRRIEALTGEAAVSYVQGVSNVLNESAHLLKERPDRLKQRIEKTLAGQKLLEKEVEALKAHGEGVLFYKANEDFYLADAVPPEFIVF